MNTKKTVKKPAKKKAPAKEGELEAVLQEEVVEAIKKVYKKHKVALHAVATFCVHPSGITCAGGFYKSNLTHKLSMKYAQEKVLMDLNQNLGLVPSSNPLLNLFS